MKEIKLKPGDIEVLNDQVLFKVIGQIPENYICKAVQVGSLVDHLKKGDNVIVGRYPGKTIFLADKQHFICRAGVVRVKIKRNIAHIIGR